MVRARSGIGSIVLVIWLLIGVLAGTYSTVTIVPAVAIAWNNATGRKRDITGPASRAGRVEEPREEAQAAPRPRKRKAV